MEKQGDYMSQEDSLFGLVLNEDIDYFFCWSENIL